MIFTYPDYITSLQHELSHRPKRVWISTYGFNVGIAETGNVFCRSPSYQLIEQVSKKTTGSRILIGIAPKFNNSLSRKLTNSAEFFPTIQWRTRSNQHLKCWIFFHLDGTKRALVGGRNLGDSDWADVSVWINGKDAQRLQAFYDSLWLKAEQVTTTKGLVLK